MALLAINGGEPTRTKPYPTWPTLDPADIDAFENIYNSGRWGVGGTNVSEFAQQFADFQGAKYGVCVNSGTSALYIALKAAEVGPGDEVITTPYTFQATVVAILMTHAVPVFVDTAPDNFLLDVSKIEDAITEKTKAILPVHIAGYPADLDGLTEIAEKHNLKLIEDCAQAHGAEWRGRGVGSWGDFGCFSFQSSKNLCAGEGGIIITNDRELYERTFALHNCGRTPPEAEFGNIEPFGGNFRMTEWQASILLSRLTRLEKETNHRHMNMRWLDGWFGEIPGIKVTRIDPRATRCGSHGYKAIFDSEEFEDISRATFLEAMRAEGIPIGYWYTTPMYRSTFLKSNLFGHNLDYSNVNCPETEKICQTGLAFSQNVLMGSEEDMEDIIKATVKIRRNVAELKDAV
ncbi:MAG: DegT/DnrJ/EryC1/StrS family aminotransferase [Candidatus Poribacteria bacterium]|nr:DegT/DnrJ/EryC1/StrS family aminotransferase [Candidatus Poribacteria bacterium]